MQVAFVKTASGLLVPATQNDTDATMRWKAGAVVRGEFAAMRNGKFFRKWWVLVQFAFDLWSERRGGEAVEYRGTPVLTDLERFRKDLTIMAGFYRPVWNARGEMRLEAESIAWANMQPERFEQLYSKTIDVILEKILPDAGLSEESLRRTVDQIMLGFA